MNLIASTLLTILSTLSPVESHSWLDCIGKSSTVYNGHNQYYGDEFYHEACTVGFPRGYPGRMNRWINDIYTYQLVGRKPEDTVCSSITQSSANYTSEFHMGKVTPGESVKLWWEADNHFNPGPTYVYVYTSGKPGQDLIKYKDLNQDTQIWKNVFATDDNCMDRSPNSLCWGNMNIPNNLTPGKYQFVWKWVWDQNPVGEEYLTCFDLEVTGNGNQPTSAATTIKPSAATTAATTAAATTTSAKVNPQKINTTTSTAAPSKPSSYIATTEYPVQATSSTPAPNHKKKCHRKADKKN
ncbi:hypothetical protein CONCODRAFT_78863 [Conidiobolus coronatus NRRL 28638]|uniref:AA9 family lytic polysaccharide monooxygenase n=1 Tax=Conidiobolus coronatus (strain ATCC 28846 / CBS 209.66 / NRRL 28638) TaxID=796925 RepID=A0A137P617_CONC2|nr:hypothetical protein CONCODRAFT_78863 [Conidiobolus coronatus NRRL 28638]|eukprot:KXN70452.1 hypothetical protein CONCODRAFT_78863 [Conidiobolus coronatus NRRL 28638]